MKAILLVTLAIATLASGYVVVPEKQVHYADKDFLVKQKAILEVFQHVHQKEVHTQLWTDSKNYNIEEHYDSFTNVEAVKEFVRLYNHGLLGFEEIFTVLNEEQSHEVNALFNIFYYAKDWETFYKVMVWARFHVNEGMFIYALTTAIYHRPDFVGIELPAIYEIYPYYFFHAEVLQKAHQYKMQGFYGMKKVEGVYQAVIPANYTGWYMHTNAEQKVSYFTEDIGLNAWYYYLQADFPYWLGGKEFGLYKDRRGELYLFHHQQLLARYYLERLSNDLGVIPEITYELPIKTGYFPDMYYYNGVPFPARDNNYIMYTEDNYHLIQEVEDYERRIRDAIDLGYIVMPNGDHVDLTKPESVEYLGNLIQTNPDSVNTRYYGFLEMYARILLGASVEHFEDHKVIPSVLEQFETSLRDPVFYQLYKRIIGFYWQFKEHLPHYTVEEIEFPGVKIEGVEMDKLVTYFDRFDADITNAVDVEVYDEKTPASELKKFGKIAHYQGEDFVIKARSTRLNTVPFTYKLSVASEKAVKGVVRAYLGPKYDSYGNVYHVNDNRENFVLLDVFAYEFQAGKNVITRNSNDFSFFVKDRTTFFELYKQVMNAYTTGDKYQLHTSEAHTGFPARLMLPKGKKGGMPYQFFFVVSPYNAPTTKPHEGYEEFGYGYVDSLPYGYPLDREINENYWFTPNMYYYDVNIFHKTQTEINASH
ncbi:CLUMA_CG020319, isoform A [Clunio marinus]|uniref:CLUMA_CG020319, isoform A n=1 Tax=Clunio marinus TaxID=568069 RepID=A0A1J1J6D1_9DIPT|nr:CLUMA_CG020319, isoform A [Clunio marinus]